MVERLDVGPALRLRTATQRAAPFSTNATGRVRHLNADRVDGKDASALASHATSYVAGRRGMTLAPGGMWSTPIAPGLYHVSFDAMVWDQNTQPPSNFICGVLDISTFGTANQRIYVASSAVYTGAVPAAVSGSATVRVKRGEEPGAVCFPETGQFQFFKRLKVSFTRINSRERRTAEAVPLARTSPRTANPFAPDS